MKKRASAPFVIWLMVIWLHAHLSLADLASANDTTSVCLGSLQDCLVSNSHHLDLQFPTITADYLGSMLGSGFPKGSPTGNTGDRNRQACKDINGRYYDCSAGINPNKNAQRCRNSYQRDC